MKAPLFNEILKISQDLADASAKDDEKSRTEHYQALIKLCANNEDSPKDHPLQWEALADFTNDSDQALDIYHPNIKLITKEKRESKPHRMRAAMITTPTTIRVV